MESKTVVSDVIVRQAEIIAKINKLQINFGKDSASRKTPEYLAGKIELLDSLWDEFDKNHELLLKYPKEAEQYISGGSYQACNDTYQALRSRFFTFGNQEQAVQPARSEKGIQPSGELDELLTLQRTHFRALSRLIKSIDVDSISEKWEIEDELRNIQGRWTTIDNTHLKIDNILAGGDIGYESEFNRHETLYKNIKRQLNSKLSSSTHTQQSVPKLEIPIFTGIYSSWPTFYDLFSETIHNNNSISKAQKMQHLKGKVRGEAGRLIQHLHISADNYDTAWDILIHRYNNHQVLFIHQIEIFLNQRNIAKQSSLELKKLYDTSTECIHAIHNLGVDTTTWDPLLVHLLCKKLDPETYCDYMESRKSPRDLASLEEFMTFLESKFTALEPITRKESSPNNQSNQIKRYPISNHSKSNYSKPYYQSNKNYQPAVNYANANKCAICNFSHNNNLFNCKKFLNMPPDMQLKALAKFRICPNCLYGHNDKECMSNKRCRECNSKHNTLLHDAYARSGTHSVTITSSQPSTSITSPPNPREINVNNVTAADEEVLLATILLDVRSADGTFVRLRGLCDQGAQVTLCSENAVQLLGLPRRHCQATVTGVGPNTEQTRGIVPLYCRSIYGDYEIETEALVMRKVINNLPVTSFPRTSWPHLQHINLADPHYNVSKPIDILLDASFYAQIIMSGLIKGPAQAPIAQQTKMGWILSGNVKTFQCHVVLNDLSEISKYWEMEDISSERSASSLTEEEQYCENFYKQTVKRTDAGSYEVGIPMKPDYETKLGFSRQKAVAQFKQQEIKMQKNKEFSDGYRKFMNEYLELKHMRPANNTENQSNYLPHHGILKLDSNTTKLRVVFNASSKSTSGLSLNDLMFSGPNIQVDLQGLILAWRSHRYVITADIEKFFRQILIRECDQHLQTIVWRDAPHHLIQDYFLTTITYGLKSSPFLAIRTLRQLAEDELERYPLAASALKSSFFMDDLLTGMESIDLCKKLQKELMAIFKSAGMNLRKWSSNEPQLLDDLSPELLNAPLEFKCLESRKTLGLKWISLSDSFVFNNQLSDQDTNKPITKRQLLSNISKIFDPLGWLSPLSIKAKLLFQKSWSSKMTWDDQISDELHGEWISFVNEFNIIGNIKIPRYLGNIKYLVQLHSFCDASEKAYACAIYFVSRNDKGECTSTLVAGKTKLSPLACKQSLARLELCGAVLLSQLLEKVLQSIPNLNAKLYAWTDSMIVLGWLQGDPSRWKQFVSNRVQKIIKVVPASCWQHVRSEDNPADCATRGLQKQALSDFKLWWEGPSWIRNFEPNSQNKTLYQPPNIDMKTVHVHVALQFESSLVSDLLQQHSSLTRVVRVIAWILRFIICSRDKQKLMHGISLSSAEINRSFNLIVKAEQSREFGDDISLLKQQGRVRINSKIISLNPFLDEEGILRVGGRLRYSSISYEAKHPMILSSHGRLTELVIDQAHITTLHGGPRLTLSYIRDKFWIISGIRTVKRQLRNCVKCRRFSHDRHQHIMADLPSPRVTPSRVFTHCGVDFSGFVELKANKGRGIKTTKGYVAVFVCFATKAVHLELVSDLSTPTFLAAFRRFCARRGTPAHMYSDNGTNFVGANRFLKKEYQEIIHNINQVFMSDIKDFPKWHFLPVAFPSAGGLWESAVKSMKYHLKQILGEQKLTYEEFSTLLHQIEACLNSRPLCQLTENADDECLTPGHFLVGGPLLSRPQTDPESVTLPKRWQMVQHMNKQFWKRWSAEYLQQLQIRSKWRTQTQNLKIGDVVIIKEDNMPPGKWALGRIQEVFPGQDGFVRVVSVKGNNKITRRPASKLIPLPVHEPESVTPSTSPDPSNVNLNDNTDPRSRRNRQGFNLKNFFINTLFLFTIFIPPSIQQYSYQSPSPNTTSLKENQGLFFDKISELQYVKDDWKLIVYYNMTTYWNSISNTKNYIKRLKELCKQVTEQYSDIILQLQNEVNEIEHYNILLKTHGSLRQRRGLINGVGYLANTLFGVLDERFAEEYKENIEKIVGNENHLQLLLKNQTSILESEYNILQRNEKAMNDQFFTVSQRLRTLSEDLNTVKGGLVLSSSIIEANILLSQVKRIQETLIDTVTDITHGHIDTRLLSPDQLQHQLNIISGQLHGDLTLPVDNDNIRNIYKLLKVAVRVISNYLVIEIKIPLVSNDIFELNKVISIPRLKDHSCIRIMPVQPYIAYNFEKDTAFLLSDADIQQCVHVSDVKILCSLDLPIYDLKSKQSFCDINTLDAYTQSSSCRTETHPCQNNWSKLHHSNNWLFSCYSSCAVRIYCASQMTLHQLSGNGIITIGRGCTLKGDSFSLYAHNNFLRSVNVQPNLILPKLSVLNSILNSTVPDISLGTYENNSFVQLKSQLDNLKAQEIQPLVLHNIHHYTLIYSIIGILFMVAMVLLSLKIRQCCRNHRASSGPLSGISTATAVSVPASDSAIKIIKLNKVNSESVQSVQGESSVDMGTSPTLPRNKYINVDTK